MTDPFTTIEPGAASSVSEPPVEISIILPAYQEEEGILPLLERIEEVMEELGRPWEVLVVDDGSTDATPARAREAGASVISHPYNIGNGAAVKTGIRNARGRVLVMMDADGQHDPADIPRLLAGLEAHDMTVGARTKQSETSFHRDLANKVYNAFASYVCNRRIEDLTSGFGPFERRRLGPFYTFCRTPIPTRRRLPWPLSAPVEVSNTFP